MEAAVRSSKLDNIKVYETDKREYAVRLDANESFKPFPEILKEELWRRLMSINFNRYPDPESEELCRLYSRYCGVKEKNVLAGNGSDELIQIIVNGFLGKDEKILTLKPGFSMYKFYTSIMEGQVIELSIDEDMKIDVDKIIERANSEDVRVIIFSNPNNPTGGIIPRKDILRIIEGCSSLVAVDEAYFEFYGETLVDCIDKYENLIVLRTLSKAAGMAAVRLGFLIANENLVQTIRKVKPPFNISALTQAAGAVVLANTHIVKANADEIKVERELLVGELKNIESGAGSGQFRVYPSRANFVYIKSSRDEEVYKKLQEEGISIRFYNNGALRISVGTREENSILVSALKKILEV